MSSWRSLYFSLRFPMVSPNRLSSLLCCLMNTGVPTALLAAVLGTNTVCHHVDFNTKE